jgi:hypothetical protein
LRLYSVALASVAIMAPEKWTDNLLAHHELPGVQSRARGVARGISWPALVHIALARETHVQIGCSVRDAIALAAALLAAPANLIAAGPHLTLTFDRERFEHDLHRHLADALESAPRPRRGRPRHRGVARHAGA